MAFKTLTNEFANAQQQYILELLVDYTKFLKIDLANVDAYMKNIPLNKHPLSPNPNIEEDEEEEKKEEFDDKSVIENIVVDPVVEPVVEPVVDPVVEPVKEPVVDPVVEPVEEPVVEPVEEPVVDPVVEPVEEPVEEPVVEPVEEPVVEPVEEPVVEKKSKNGKTKRKTKNERLPFHKNIYVTKKGDDATYSYVTGWLKEYEPQRKDMELSFIKRAAKKWGDIKKEGKKEEWDKKCREHNNKVREERRLNEEIIDENPKEKTEVISKEVPKKVGKKELIIKDLIKKFKAFINENTGIDKYIKYKPRELSGNELYNKYLSQYLFKVLHIDIESELISGVMKEYREKYTQENDNLLSENNYNRESQEYIENHLKLKKRIVNESYEELNENQKKKLEELAKDKYIFDKPLYEIYETNKEKIEKFEERCIRYEKELLEQCEEYKQMFINSKEQNLIDILKEENYVHHPLIYLDEINKLSINIKDFRVYEEECMMDDSDIESESDVEYESD
jgi:hypothetical protein